jgi:two-component system, chemotaxis family, CheB/CheR fusion protein
MKKPPGGKGAVKKSAVGNKTPSKIKSPAIKFSPENKTDRPAEDLRFPVVGIGSSAGGLEALETFFPKMPAKTGMAFILVPHLDPTHTSILPELVQRHTSMKVLQAEDGMTVEPDHVYIIPPNKDMAIFRRTLQLTVPEKTTRGLRMPIDYFLRSLAEDQGEMAVCVIMSGTGTDGSLGLRAVHAAGGMTMVQEVSSAKYEGMPKSAIDTKLADYVLPAAQMPVQLLSYVKKNVSKKARVVSPVETPNAIQKILFFLRSQTGQDFSSYKKSTVLRRIERRMTVHNIEDPNVYLRYLQEHREEGRLLFKELLITVTSFFRDPETFDILKKKIWPRLFGGRSENSAVRVWVPGCASGEEAYSIAITLREYMTEAGREFKAQIFGTDIDEDSINQARTGIYPGNIAMDLSKDRLRRFFTKENGGYRVKKDIREMLVFAVQNVIKDAPFTKINLLSCRNLLIYMEPEMQNRLLPLFHYSLKPGGVLFLGSSESIGRFANLFNPLDKKWKFFEAKAGGPSQGVVGFPSTFGYEARATGTEEKREKKPNIGELVQKWLLGTFAPPSVLVDERGDILHIHGQTGRYLEPAPGQPALNLLTMAREGIRLELRSALHRVVTRKKEIRYQDLKVRTNGGYQPVNITVKPLTEIEGMQNLCLVSFEEPAPKKLKEGKTRPRQAEKKRDKQVEELERELLHTRETLQSTVEEMQSSNEELKSANEELQSTNEELQSTNEELETSKEELQSVNEELTTVNSELQGKIEQLSQTETDMKMVFDSIQVAAVFLDADLRIKRYTSEALKLFKLVSTDLGRPIGDIRSNFEYRMLVEEARRVLETLEKKEGEVRTEDGNLYLMRIMPSRSAENAIDGVVFTFTDISRIREMESRNQAQQIAMLYAEGIVNTVREPLIVLDKDFRVISANRSFYRLFKVRKEETEGQYFYELGGRQWDIPALREHLQEILPQEQKFEDFVVDHEFPKIGKREIVLNGRKIVHKDPEVQMILLAMEDITKQGEL